MLLFRLVFLSNGNNLSLGFKISDFIITPGVNAHLALAFCCGFLIFRSV